MNSLYDDEKITVKRDKTVMIHFINSASLAEFEISIDNHIMLVIEADGTYLKNLQEVQKNKNNC